MTISALYSTWSSPFLNGTSALNSSSSSVQSGNVVSSNGNNNTSDTLNISSAAYDALNAAMKVQPAKHLAQTSGSSNSGTSSNYQQMLAEIVNGRKTILAAAQSDPTSQATKQFAYDLAHPNLTAEQTGGLIDITGTVPGGPVNYTSGAPVTADSQAYYTQQATSYQKAASQLYDSAMAKGDSPAQIISQIYDLQSQQSAQFRAMNMWPT